MQGPDGNAFPGAFYLDYGSNGINLRCDQNNVVPADALLHGGQPVMDWMGQSSSSVNTQTPVQYQDLLADDGMLYNRMDQSTSSTNTQIPVRFQDLLAEDGLLSSPVTGAVVDQNFAERHSEPIIAPSLTQIDISLGNGQFTNRPLSLQQASFSALPQNIDLNAACDSHGVDAYLNTETALCLNPFKPGRPDVDQNPFSINSSIPDPLVISSGIAGYVVEENDNRGGCSSDDRRLSCKRRAPEDGLRQLSLGESSRSSHLSENMQENASRRLNLSAPTYNHSNVQYSEQLGTGLVVGSRTTPVMYQPSSAAMSGLRAGAGASSDVHQTLTVIGETENSQRNVRMRRTVNHQGFAPADLALWTRRNSYAQLPGQPTVFFPSDCVPNASSVTGIGQSTHMMQSVHAPNSLEVLQPFQGNAVTRSGTGLLSSAYALNGGDSFLLENNPHNVSNGTHPFEIQRRNLEHMLSNVNFVPGTSSPGNIASTSRNSSSSCTHPLLAPIWFPQGNMAHQYAHRVTDIVNRTESQGQGSYRPLHLGVSFAARERELSARGGFPRPSQVPFRSGLVARAERQIGAHPEVALRSLTTAQRRSRLVSEVRNALALVRRGGSIQFEDVMVIDRSVLYGVPEEPDLHEDMRLDVDNMSYEELLALEDQIGNVCTGISEDIIQTGMKRQKYKAIEVGSPRKDEPCCICQEEYVDGQDLGKLDCGHNFHFNCIKQWLVQKNNCPICKMTALEV